MPSEGQKIQALPEDLRNKISAGEVVERPASALKELLENSLDSGASEIRVILEQGGKRLIQVGDNGHGIRSAELKLAFERYSTSKIGTVDDLFKISTLGFRGEALSSIASVSQVKVISKTGDGDAIEMKVEGGNYGDLVPAAGENGTLVQIENLFYNTPARRKFLKSDKVELRQAVNIFRRMALAYPEVNFELIADGKQVMNLKSETLEERISAVFDPTYRKNLIPVEILKGNYHVSGFLGNLNLVRSRPGEQFIFLNRRYIKDRLLNSAVYSGYKSLTKRGEFPFFVLNLVLPSDQVDVNVHPMKTEVRFRDEWRIYHVLKSGSEEALKDILATIPDMEKGFMGSGFNPGSQSSLDMTHSEGGSGHTGETTPGSDPGRQIHSGLERAKNYVSSLAGRKTEEAGIDVENIWQIHNKYIASQIKSGVVLIDQHVAHERVLFEEAQAAMESTPMPSQTLLFPEVLQFSPDEFSVLLDILPYLERIGFRLREYGKDTILVEGIPSEMAFGNEREVIRNILDHYVAHQKEYSSFQENLAASFACHAAIKAGDSLTLEEMRVLINRLFKTRHPYYCPHGRPILIHLTLSELDRRFER